MHALSTLRLSGILPGSLRRFIVPSWAPPNVTTLSIGAVDTADFTASNLGQFGISTASVDCVMEQPVDVHEVALGTPLQYGPPPRAVWYCGNCGDGPHNIAIQTGCSSCGHTKDSCCTTSTI
ncbi:hypothetical protein P171DRAFT_435588 [Karstenula rhodostoma CBS 690.94]|uniref:Uncharacterized protein n=1 Tax=Karstenula rhodostoma CBS 690.94 TaxID=1392251 RepID=A0A9P4P7A3_9PLEO|nr:hypothetical protein P171DRAFT_435588 [Karstenula rhodostoma CBS 690.94]